MNSSKPLLQPPEAGQLTTSSNGRKWHLRRLLVGFAAVAALAVLIFLLLRVLTSSCCCAPAPQSRSISCLAARANATAGGAMLALKLVLDSVLDGGMKIPVGFRSPLIEIRHVSVRAMRASGSMAFDFAAGQNASVAFNAEDIWMAGDVRVSAPGGTQIVSDFECNQSAMQARAQMAANGSPYVELRMTTGPIKAVGLGKAAKAMSLALKLVQRVQECSQRALQGRILQALQSAWDSPAVNVTLYNVTIDWDG